MPTKRSMELVQRAQLAPTNSNKQQRQHRLPSEILEPAPPSVSSRAPSLSASEEKNMHEVFQGPQVDLSPVKPIEKCSNWMQTNEKRTCSTVGGAKRLTIRNTQKKKEVERRTSRSTTSLHHYTKPNVKLNIRPIYKDVNLPAKDTPAPPILTDQNNNNSPGVETIVHRNVPQQPLIITESVSNGNIVESGSCNIDNNTLQHGSTCSGAVEVPGVPITAGSNPTPAPPLNDKSNDSNDISLRVQTIVQPQEAFPSVQGPFVSLQPLIITESVSNGNIVESGSCNIDNNTLQHGSTCSGAVEVPGVPITAGSNPTPAPPLNDKSNDSNDISLRVQTIVQPQEAFPSVQGPFVSLQPLIITESVSNGNIVESGSCNIDNNTLQHGSTCSGAVEVPDVPITAGSNPTPAPPLNDKSNDSNDISLRVQTIVQPQEAFPSVQVPFVSLQPLIITESVSNGNIDESGSYNIDNSDDTLTTLTSAATLSGDLTLEVPSFVTPESTINVAVPPITKSLHVMSSQTSTSRVKKNLFPSDDNIGQSIGNIAPSDLAGALILPLNEEVSLENVISIEIEENLEHQSEDFIPETEAENVGSNVKKRKRTSVESDVEPTRKRKCNRENWKQTKDKLAHNAGLAHTTRKGVVKRARSVKPPCPDSCRKKCKTKVTEELRQQLFHKYWNVIQGKTSQWLFLAKLIRRVPIKQRKVFADQGDAWRKHSYEYYLKGLGENDREISVCQTMFLNTFDISSKAAKFATTKNSPDKRGKHQHKKLNPAIVNSVKEHIKRFPLVPSHYCRADSQKKYLDENLSVAKMYRMYLLEQEEGAPKATERNYRDIFNTHFNLSFFKPKKDQCSLCTDFNLEKASEEQALEYNLHREEKEKIRQQKKEDKELSKESPNVRVVTFDLQKILYCPRVEIAEFYYKRKLSSFNSTFFDCTEKQTYCYCWDLTIGKKGADEIATFAFDYIETKVNQGVNDFRFYTDSCPGQNKNKYLFCMYYYAAMKFQIKITHSWLVKGHTQMECDNVHARIEKKTKNEQVYTPSQWYGFIKTAKVKKPAYIVKEVNKDINVLTFRPLDEHFTWSKVPITKLRKLIVDFNNPTKVTCQTECDGPIKEYTVLKRKPGRPVNWTTLQMKKAYSGKLPLKPKLIKDLKWYMQKGFIPDAHMNFFRYVVDEPIVAPLIGEDDSDEDDTPQEITLPEGEHILENPEENVDDPHADSHEVPGEVPDEDPPVVLAEVSAASDGELSDEYDDFD